MSTMIGAAMMAFILEFSAIVEVEGEKERRRG
jgi:hypothetical protein